jgi:hypothetical protein
MDKERNLKWEALIQGDKTFQGKLRNLRSRYTFEACNSTNDMECHDFPLSDLMKGDDEP